MPDNNTIDAILNVDEQLDLPITDDRSIFQQRAIVDWVFRTEQPKED